MMRSARAARWTARIAVALTLVLGCLVFWSAVETGHGWLYAMAATGIGGALLFSVGVERPGPASGRVLRPMGWLMMFGFSLVPTSLLFLPAVVVLCAAPVAFGWGVDPRNAGVPASR
jgi:hypothetical protein